MLTTLILFFSKMLFTHIHVPAIDLSTQTLVHNTVLRDHAYPSLACFFDYSSVSAGILKIHTPLCFRLVAQPYMKRCAPGIAKKSSKYGDFKFPQLDL